MNIACIPATHDEQVCTEYTTYNTLRQFSLVYIPRA